MSEGKKLPALSLEVKSSMIPHDEIVYRHIWGVTFFSPDEKKPGASN